MSKNFLLKICFTDCTMSKQWTDSTLNITGANLSLVWSVYFSAAHDGIYRPPFPFMEALMTWQPTDVCHKHTHLDFSRHRKQLALQRGHRPTVAAERNRWSLVEGENHSSARKHHQYVFIDMDTVYNGLHHADRGRDGGRGKWLLGNSHIMKNKPKKSEALRQQM